jgi:4-diphosphocytidyl-2-C-methyl-D-erythritol kinase
MSEEAAPGQLRVRAPAKVNLSLEVLGRRPDGYHEIRTVMQAVSLCDEIEFESRSDGLLRLECVGADLPADESNLVLRAARLLRERSGAHGGADVRLTKRVPLGGGLGGGSSDAAITLLALAELWGLTPSGDELTEMAAELGSDVPFFLTGGAALCEGRGERVTPLPCPRTLRYVLAMPQWSVSTARVYQRADAGLTDRGAAHHNVVEALSEGDPERLGRCLHNDLEEAACAESEGLRAIRRALAQCTEVRRACGYLLSGSGSSFFVVSRGRSRAERVARAVESELGIRCVIVQSLPAWHANIRSLRLGRELR